MTRLRLVAIHAMLFAFAAVQSVAAADLSRYRTYTLGDTLASVVAACGTDPSDVKTVHERPGLIQEIEWRTPYAGMSERPDPVQTIVFRFNDGKLYQLTVTYDRVRMAGLTDQDVVDALAPTYGAPASRAKGNRGATTADRATNTTVLARWSDDVNRLTLSRDVDWRRYQLVLLSRPLEALAQAAIGESIRLDLKEKPQRDLDLQTKVALEAEQARIANRAAFHP
jgi:hypothetical protein